MKYDIHPKIDLYEVIQGTRMLESGAIKRCIVSNYTKSLYIFLRTVNLQHILTWFMIVTRVMLPYMLLFRMHRILVIVVWFASGEIRIHSIRIMRIVWCSCWWSGYSWSSCCSSGSCCGSSCRWLRSISWSWYDFRNSFKNAPIISSTWNKMK